MTDFLAQLIYRSQGNAVVVQPRIAPRFAMALSIAADLPDFSVFQPDSLNQTLSQPGITYAPETTIAPSPQIPNFMPSVPDNYWSAHWSRMPQLHPLDLAQLLESQEWISQEQIGSIALPSSDSAASGDQATTPIPALPQSQNANQVVHQIINHQTINQINQVEQISNDENRPSLSPDQNIAVPPQLTALPSPTPPELNSSRAIQPAATPGLGKPAQVTATQVEPAQTASLDRPVQAANSSRQVDRAVVSPPFASLPSSSTPSSPLISSTPTPTISSSSNSTKTDRVSALLPQTSNSSDSSVSTSSDPGRVLEDSSKTIISHQNSSSTLSPALNTDRFNQAITQKQTGLSLPQSLHSPTRVQKNLTLLPTVAPVNSLNNPTLNSALNSATASSSRSLPVSPSSLRSNSNNQVTSGLPTLQPIATLPSSPSPSPSPSSSSLPIHITIGRVEVRSQPAVPAPLPRRSSSSKPKPKLSLNDYLTQRRGGSSGGQP